MNDSSSGTGHPIDGNKDYRRVFLRGRQEGKNQKHRRKV